VLSIEMTEIFIQTFFLYFIVIDPLGTTPLFLIVTQHMETKNKIKTALSATTIAAVILLFFALAGSSLLSYLNISFPAFTIAGGIILFLISMEMLFDKRQQRKEDDLEYNSERVSVFPLATPLLAGPAGITSVIVSVSDIGSDFTSQVVGMLSLVLVLVLTFIIFFVASKSSKIINKKIISIISRVIAIILAGLSVQYILDGIKTFLA
jgi:multiple antibiotic resistance protein